MSVVSTHNAGFFSCCSVKLHQIVEYINSHSNLPNTIDSSAQFELYKKENAQDVTYDYFEHYDNVKNDNIKWPIEYSYHCQFHIYSNMDKNIYPLVKKYFTPSKQIIENSEYIKQKYNIDCNNTIAVYYRGTDKCTETSLAGYDIFLKKITEIKHTNNNATILIQTDSSQFVDFMKSQNLENVVVLRETSTSYETIGLHFEKNTTENYHDMFNLFAIFIVLAQCKHLVFGSCNGSLWITFYRGHCERVHQYLNGTWYG